MARPYHCPNCKKNKTRFNIIEQQPQIVKLDANTGETISTHTISDIEAYHMTYQGPDFKVQCGVCGLLEDEEMFARYAIYSRRKEHQS